IRDATVTGVQTCALPIYASRIAGLAEEAPASRPALQQADFGAGADTRSREPRKAGPQVEQGRAAARLAAAPGAGRMHGLLLAAALQVAASGAEARVAALNEARRL